MADYYDNRDETETEEELSDGDQMEDLDFEPDDQDRDDVYAEYTEEQGDDDQEEEDEQDPDSVPKLDKQNLKLYKLCPDHEAGKMTRSCLTCVAALSLITDKSIIKELCSESRDLSLSSRYAGHCDTVVPTLNLDHDTITLAVNIFSKGTWSNPKLFSDLVKKYLTLPEGEHQQLTSDIKLEDSLRRYRKQKRFKYVFDYLKDLEKCLCNLRVVQRPLFALMEKTNADLVKVRSIGEKASLKFPEAAPIKADGDGVHVPRAGHAVPDQLKVSSRADILPRPDVDKFVRDHGLDLNATNALVDLLEDYRKDVGGQFMELYDVIAEHLNASEDYFMFYTNIYSFVDSALRELMRNKVVNNLFRNDIKSDIIDQSSNKKMKDVKPSGILGG